MSDVQTVHVVFKTHLDIGFTDLARNVVRQYHERFIPQALATAEALRARGGSERMVWTTGAWLIDAYLREASDPDRAQLERAIRAGDIVWHALPFTTHTELLDPGLFQFGLGIAAALDRRFGRTTIAAKLTDVPGHTRGCVPLLAAAGVRFLHLGANPGSETPDVPPVFRWQVEGAEVVVAYSRGGYGNLVVVPGLSDALLIAHTDDNRGPHTPEQVLAVFAALQQRFPGARVVASTLDAFAEALLAQPGALPIVTAELGDTWIHGAASDPLKIGRFRELQRLRTRWLTDDPALATDPALDAFSRQLIMVPEHTWGLDEKTFLADEVNYAAAEFAAARPTAPFQRMEESWREQRAYLDAALAALDGTPQGAEAQAALAALQPRVPDLGGFATVAEPAAVIETTHFRIAFDPMTGAITWLQARASGRQWADPDHGLALLSYQVYGAAEFERFMGQYNINPEQTLHWTRQDFGKPGIERALPQGARWEAALRALHQRRDADGQRFVAELALPAAATAQFGAPRRICLEVTLPDAAPVVEIALQWWDKPACRIGEALWLAFRPLAADPFGWRLDKLGLPLEPHDVVRNGNRQLHAVGDGMRYTDTRGTLRIETLDAPLVAPGAPALLDFHDRQPDPAQGLHVNLYNNVWGTNFPMWFDEDMRFRFRLAV